MVRKTTHGETWITVEDVKTMNVKENKKLRFEHKLCFAQI